PPGRRRPGGRGAFGGVRVMVNCNQMGQAAGTAAWLALSDGIGVSEVAPEKLRATLEDQGAIIL
ncbi:MAG: FAD-dependent oxidoreductase, partial [Pirellulaceae bacterium]